MSLERSNVNISKNLSFNCGYSIDTHKNTLYVELAHGGHLGFYEGGLIYPNPVTWLDRAVVSMIGGIVLSHHNSIHKKIDTDF